MTEQCAVVKVQLRIEADHIILGRDDKRIDLNLRAVLADERIVKLLHQSRRLANRRSRDIDGIRHARRLERSKSDDRIDIFLDDLFRSFGSDLLDLNAAFLGTHHDDPRRGAVNDKAQVVFLFDIRAFFNQEATDLLALRPRLMRDENLAKQLLRVAFDLFNGLGNLDAARLAAATRVDLRLNDRDSGAEFLRVLDRLFHAERRQAVRHIDAEFPQDLLGLVLMNIHNHASLLMVLGTRILLPLISSHKQLYCIIFLLVCLVIS